MTDTLDTSIERLGEVCRGRIFTLGKGNWRMKFRPASVRRPADMSTCLPTTCSGLPMRPESMTSILITADYVAWYNQQRLMHRLGRVPPAEAEAQCYPQHVTDRPAGSKNPRVNETRDAPLTRFGHHY